MKTSLLRSSYLFLVGLLLTLNVLPAQAGDLQENINDAYHIIRSFKDLPEDQSIPDKVLHDAKGLAVLNVIKVGFVFSGQGGEGIIIARSSKGWNGWSAPSGISTGGAGVGFQIGGQNTEFVIVLNTQDAVDAFTQGTNVKLGGEVSVAAGPVGRNLNGSVLPTAAVYSYSRSEGLFAGVSLEGAVIAVEKETNDDYYGHHVTAERLLTGDVAVPEGAHRLITALNAY